MTTQEIITFLNLKDVADALITDALADGAAALTRKGLTVDETNSEIKTALKYMTAYYLLPKLTHISGEKGLTKEIGFGENAQHLIDDTDIIRRQEFYLKEANTIITSLLNTQYPFGIDI